MLFKFRVAGACWRRVGAVVVVGGTCSTITHDHGYLFAVEAVEVMVHLKAVVPLVVTIMGDAGDGVGGQTEVKGGTVRTCATRENRPIGSCSAIQGPLCAESS